MAEQNEQPQLPVRVEAGERGLQLQNLDDMIRFGQAIIDAGMAPKGITKPGAVVALVQAGQEIGLPYMQSLSNLTFTNGRLGIMGDAAKSLIYKAKVLKYGTMIRHTFEGEPGSPDFCAVVTAHRDDMDDPVESRFSVRDAKNAGLWGKQGPWTNYPRRMLMYRALGFLVRDYFPDVMKGLVLTEELRDYPRPERGPRPVGATLVAGETHQPAGPDPLGAFFTGGEEIVEPIEEDRTGEGDGPGVEGDPDKASDGAVAAPAFSSRPPVDGTPQQRGFVWDEDRWWNPTTDEVIDLKDAPPDWAFFKPKTETQEEEK